MRIWLFVKLSVGFAFLFVTAQILFAYGEFTPHVNVENSGENNLFLPVVSKPFVPIPSEMVHIPAGHFQMGCDLNNLNEECVDNELPLHTIYLDAYYIDKYEVTNDQFAQFLNNRTHNTCVGYDCITLDDSSVRIRFENGQYVVDMGYGNHPVNLVTWYGADTYCKENGRRLPTEAEWEKAGRGSVDARKYPWGNDYPDCTLVNFYKVGPEKCIEDTAPVGSLPAGASMYGIFDMSGNVSEWVNDWYATDYYGNSPQNNPAGPDTGLYKIQRGGSWYNGSQYIRIARRVSLNPAYSDYEPGFRCAATTIVK